MLDIDGGSVTEVNAVQRWKTASPIVVIDGGSVKEINDVQS